MRNVLLPKPKLLSAEMVEPIIRGSAWSGKWASITAKAERTLVASGGREARARLLPQGEKVIPTQVGRSLKNRDSQSCSGNANVRIRAAHQCRLSAPSGRGRRSNHRLFHNVLQSTKRIEPYRFGKREIFDDIDPSLVALDIRNVGLRSSQTPRNGRLGQAGGLTRAYDDRAKTLVTRGPEIARQRRRPLKEATPA